MKKAKGYSKLNLIHAINIKMRPSCFSFTYKTLLKLYFTENSQLILAFIYRYYLTGSPCQCQRQRQQRVRLSSGVSRRQRCIVCVCVCWERGYRWYKLNTLRSLVRLVGDEVA